MISAINTCEIIFQHTTSCSFADDFPLLEPVTERCDDVMRRKRNTQKSMSMCTPKRELAKCHFGLRVDEKRSAWSE